MWEKELELIDSLGKLYPKICISHSHIIEYERWRGNISDKVWWVHLLCVFQLKHRLSCLEKFIKENDNGCFWNGYIKEFNIMDG